MQLLLTAYLSGIGTEKVAIRAYRQLGVWLLVGVVHGGPYILCKTLITQELFLVPVIVESGLSYEEDVLKSHYAKNGRYDPITRQVLKK